MQDEINKEYTPEQLSQLDTLIEDLEAFTADLPVLSAEEKAGLVKAPDNSGSWMRNMLFRSQQNLNKLSRAYQPETVERDLKLDRDIEPRAIRLQRVLDRFGSTQFLARSDAFSALLGVRRGLKDAGVAGVDDDLSEGLQRFFSRTAKPKPTPGTPPPAQ